MWLEMVQWSMGMVPGDAKPQDHIGEVVTMDGN